MMFSFVGGRYEGDGKKVEKTVKISPDGNGLVKIRTNAEMTNWDGFVSFVDCLQFCRH